MLYHIIIVSLTISLIKTLDVSRPLASLSYYQQLNNTNINRVSNKRYKCWCVTLKRFYKEIMNTDLYSNGSHLWFTIAILPALVMSPLNQTIALKCQYGLDNTSPFSFAHGIMAINLWRLVYTPRLVYDRNARIILLSIALIPNKLIKFSFTSYFMQSLGIFI